MLKSPEDDLQEAVRAIVESARAIYGSNLTRVTIDPSASGEAPFQVWLPDEPVPLSGIARAPSLSAEYPKTSPAKRNTPTESKR
jgi:hypothetical protein